MLKIILLGNGNVGKTTIKNQWMGKEFMKSYFMTIGADFQVKTVPLNDKTTLKIQVWDVAGQVRFTSVRNLYYYGAHGVLLVYDITNEQSFKDLLGWLRQCRTIIPKAKIIIVGNKKDLMHDRVISFEDGEKFASANHVLFNETSALTGENITEVFSKLIEVITQPYIKSEESHENVSMTQILTPMDEQITTVDPDHLFGSNEVIFDSNEKGQN